jgi:hypothetical protein
MKDLPSDAIVSRPVGNVPIESAGGGHGVIEGGQAKQDKLPAAVVDLPAGPMAD